MTPPRAVVEVARTARVLAEVPSTLAWLSASERARVDTLRHAGRRDHYLAGHWLARVLLARVFGGPVSAWSLNERRSLPPRVAGHEDTHFVSLSHSGEWVAAAVADARVGIDIEQRGRVLDASIAPLLLEPDESPGPVDADVLLQRWVAKEAALKRMGAAALPAQLAHTRLLPVASPDRADVRLVRSDAFHVGLALAAGIAATIEADTDAALAPGPWFAVRIDS